MKKKPKTKQNKNKTKTTFYGDENNVKALTGREP